MKGASGQDNNMIDLECFSCGSGCAVHGGKPCLCGGEEQLERGGAMPSGHTRLEYAKHFEHDNPDATKLKSLMQPGALVRCHAMKTGARDIISEFYELDQRPLGRGTYGQVFGATHRKSGVRRAVKSVEKACLRRYVNNVSAFIQREIDCLLRLDHPNIVKIYETFETEEQTDLVLEVCEGGDLLERLALSNPRLPESEAAGLFAQMLGAVQHLYLAGVVHRDLKPDNFLFSRREPAREPLPPALSPLKLIDFGLSRRLSSAAQLYMTPKIGTTEYMAPEAFAGKLSAAHANRADMWSLGVILHIVFLGHFPSPKLIEVPPRVYFSNPCFGKVSPQGIDLLASLLRKDPLERPAVTAALAHPWLAVTRQCGEIPGLLQLIPRAVRDWQCCPRLRHLALVAAAREVDDRDVGVLRRLFHMLELECAGALTKPALERASSCRFEPVAVAARELLIQFDQLDVSGSNSIEWTALVAAVLSSSGRQRGTDDVHSRGSKDSAIGPHVELPRMSDDACWSAFDLLSQGSGMISGVSLGRLLAPGEVPAWLSRGSDNAAWALPASSRNKANRIADFDRLVREVNPSGAISSNEFVSLLRGDGPLARSIQAHYASMPSVPTIPPSPLSPPAPLSPPTRTHNQG